jgi:riboflavin synthase
VLADIVPKGSVAVDGVSLTVARMEARGFTIALIPTTLEHTTLAEARVADLVNIETDILVRTVRAQVERLWGSTPHLTVEKLREAGF